MANHAEGGPKSGALPPIARHFDVSKEAAARAYARYHPENIAIVVIKDGIVKRAHKGLKFPWISAAYGKPVPKGSVFYKKNSQQRVASDVVSVTPDNWIDVKFGERAPEIYEQVYPQQDGYALLMLWYEAPDKDEDEDPDENRTYKQRLQERQSRWR